LGREVPILDGIAPEKLLEEMESKTRLERFRMACGN
jgi:hypothetical protein